MIYGRDVSNYQGKYTWPDVTFGFAKATEGTTFTDKFFASNWRNMKTRGMVRGAYHYAHPGNDPVIEAEHFCTVVGAHGLEDGDLIALDLETADGRGLGDVGRWAASWLRRVEALTGHRPLVYTFRWFASSGACANLGEYPLWLADPDAPAGRPVMPVGPWRTWVIHQYGTGPVDRDVSHLTRQQLAALGTDMTPEDVWTANIPKGPDFDAEWPAGTHVRHGTVQHGDILKNLGAVHDLVAALPAAINQAVHDALAGAVVHVEITTSSGTESVTKDASITTKAPG